MTHGGHGRTVRLLRISPLKHSGRIKGRVLFKTDSLVFTRISSKHQVGITPRRLGCIHVKSVVFHSARIPLDIHSAITITFGKAAQKASKAIVGLLEFGHSFLLLFGLVRIFNNSMPVKRRAVIHLHDNAELVRVDQVDDTDADANQHAKTTSA